MESLAKDSDRDYNWALGLNRISLGFMGIWPLNESNVPDKISANKRLRVPIMIIVIFFGLFLPQMYALTLVIREMSLVIENLITSSAAFFSCIKLFFIWGNVKVLRPVILSAWKDWHSFRSSRELEEMRKQASRGRLITILDYSIVASCFCGFVVAPIVGFDLRAINNITDYGARKLLFQSYYPYDYSISPCFELSFFFQLLGSFFVGLAMSIPDDYFGALVFHLSAEFNILGADIRRLVDHGYRDGMSLDERFRACVDRHVHLNKMASAVERTFSYVIGSQIFCMSLIVCCLGFIIISMLEMSEEKPTTLQIMTLTSTLITMMIHTLVDCFASEALASSSGDIFFNIYSSKWYVLPWRQKKYLVPMMVASKIPRQIKAGQLIEMSLATYCSIIKSTAGYISVLIAVRET